MASTPSWSIPSSATASRANSYQFSGADGCSAAEELEEAKMILLKPNASIIGPRYILIRLIHSLAVTPSSPSAEGAALPHSGGENRMHTDSFSDTTAA